MSFEEGVQFLARRRQADEVEVDAAEQRGLVRFAIGFEAAFLPLGGEEGIDGIGR